MDALFQWPTALALLALACVGSVLILASPQAGAARVLFSDDFDLPDGSAPDPSNWTVSTSYYTDKVIVTGGALRTATATDGFAIATCANAFSRRNITVELDYRLEEYGGRSFELSVLTWSYDRYVTAFSVFYQEAFYDWGITTRVDGATTSTEVNGWSLSKGELYYVTMKIEDDLSSSYARASVYARSSVDGRTAIRVSDVAIDQLSDLSTVRLGVRTMGSSRRPAARWDNLTIVDHLAPPNDPPVWGTLPLFEAVEDVNLELDLAPHVSDDKGLANLSISSDSPYFRGADHLLVTLLFVRGSALETVRMSISDGDLTAEAVVNFTIEEVNDPPTHRVAATESAVEGYAEVWDLSPYVQDEDDAMEELFIIVDSPYATASGLVLTFEFAEGMRQHTLSFSVSDGTDAVDIVVVFFISAVDNPPTLDPLGSITVIEDQTHVLDLAPYIHDMDTPLGALAIEVLNTANCTVEGTRLHLLYARGDVTEEVIVQVVGVMGTARGSLQVTVLERDDPPVISDIPTQFLREDTIALVDLSPYISDEESPDDLLSLHMVAPQLLSIDGLWLVLYFNISSSVVVLTFSVSDGNSGVTGELGVQVLPVNDPPRILSIGGVHDNVTLVARVGTTREFVIVAEDEDDPYLDYTVLSLYKGISASGSRLTIQSASAEPGVYTGTLVVSDRSGIEDRMPFTLVLLEHDAPSVVIDVIEPHAWRFELNETIVFRVVVYSVEAATGEVSYVTWVSDRQGVLLSRSSDDGLSGRLSNLSKGEHRITVRATVGNLTGETSFVILVGEEGLTMSVYIMMGVVLSISIIIAITYGFARMSRFKSLTMVDESWEGAPSDAQVGPVGATVGPETPIPIAPPPQEPPRPPPTVAVTGPRPEGPVATTAASPGPHGEPEVQAIFTALSRLPNGLPRELRIYEVDNIAMRIVAGKRKVDPDGTPLVFVLGTWYIDTPDDPTRFMRHGPG